MNHRISLIIVLCLLAGMSWAQSWLPQALPGEPAFRLLECGYREAQLETCRPILPISTSWAVETEEEKVAEKAPAEKKEDDYSDYSYSDYSYSD